MEKLAPEIENGREILKKILAIPRGDMQNFGLSTEAAATDLARAGIINKVVDVLPENVRSEFIGRWGEYEVGVDETFVAQLISGAATSFEQYPFAGFYHRLAQYEFQLAHLKAGDTLFHAGCGPLPGTDICLSQLGVKVTGVEVDNTRTREAIAVLEKLTELNQLGSGSVGVRNYAVETVRFNGYKVILFSAMVPDKPTTQVLRDMHSSLGSGGENPDYLILRDTWGIGRLMYPPITGKSTVYEFVDDTRGFLNPNDRIISKLYKIKIAGRMSDLGGAGTESTGYMPILSSKD
jgi:hypothetical protein